MIHYALVSGPPAAVEKAAERLPRVLENTRVLEGERSFHIAPDRTWALAAISAPDSLAGERLVIDGDRALVVNGPALTSVGDQTDLARTALDRFVTGGPRLVVDGLGGAYNVCAIDPRRGLHAFPDFSGLYPVYWHESPRLAIVSNRSTTAARLAGFDGWDLRALAWVIGHANLFGGRVPAGGVAYVPPGHLARARPGTKHLVIERAPTWAWPSADDADGRDNLTDAEWADVTASLVANFKAVATMEGPLRLGLTGGKDSRLCLALALAAGLRDEIQTFTTGTFDSPEVEVGAAVAKVAGVANERIGPPIPDPDEPVDDDDADDAAPPPPPVVVDPGPIWHKLAEDAYRYEGMICAWSGLQNPTRPPARTIKGFGGEFFRRGNAKQFRDGKVATVDELAEMFVNYHQRHDPLGVLLPDVAEYQRNWLREWVHMSAEEIRLDLLPERFYIDHRLGHWSGPLLQSSPLRLSINPLLSQLAVAKNNELSVSARSAERFHFEVMRHAAPELVTFPFLHDTWAPEIVAGSPLPLATEPFELTLHPRRARSWGNPGWNLLDSQQLEIEKLFHQAMHKTEMDQICDMGKLKRIAKRAGQLEKSAAIKELFSCIGTSITLLGRSEQIVDG